MSWFLRFEPEGNKGDTQTVYTRTGEKLGFLKLEGIWRFLPCNTNARLDIEVLGEIISQLADSNDSAFHGAHL